MIFEVSLPILYAKDDVPEYVSSILQDILTTKSSCYEFIAEIAALNLRVYVPVKSGLVVTKSKSLVTGSKS